MNLPNLHLTDLISYGFAAAVTVSCVRNLKPVHLREDFSVFKDRKVSDWVWTFIFAILIWTFMAALATVSSHFSSIFQFSWLNLIANDPKNVAPTNLMTSGLRIPFFGLLFVPLLFLNLPRLAAAEEHSFRLGTQSWLQAIPRSLGFGLMHMVVGVPLWVGLALSVPGLWFTHEYFKGGVSRSTMAHAIYNMMLVTAIFVYLISLLFGYR